MSRVPEMVHLDPHLRNYIPFLEIHLRPAAHLHCTLRREMQHSTIQNQASSKHIEGRTTNFHAINNKLKKITQKVDWCSCVTMYTQDYI
jgi:hypothetical protein